MLTGEIRNQVGQIWNAFWSGGIANPLEVMEQITYLLFIRRLDELHTLAESRAARTGRPLQHGTIPAGSDPRGRPYQDLRWSRFKNMAPAEMHQVVGEHVFPFLRTLGGDGSTYAHHMKDARFTIPTPALLARVVDMIELVPMADRDTKGDLYEYMAEEQKLDAVVSLPSGAFRPYAGVSTAILLFTRTDSGGTGGVWFYDLQADGWSLDDKRAPLLAEDRLGPLAALAAGEHAKNNLPDALARWRERDGAERDRPRTAQSFVVPRAEIAAAGWDLSLNRYKEVAREAGVHRTPKEILAELGRLEDEIRDGMRALEGMLG